MKSIKEILNGHEQKEPVRRNYYLIPGMRAANFKETFDNYEFHILKYNTEVKEKNKIIDRYNKNYNENILTPEDIAAQARYHKLYKHLPTDDFNKQVEKINEVHRAHIMKMRRHITIKYATQRVFAEIVKHQARSLSNRARQNAKVGLSSRLPKNQPVDLLIWRSKIAEPLGITKKTASEHIKRLLMANILVSYQYRGSQQAFKIQINPDILSLSDLAIRQNSCTSQGAENQFFKTTSRKKLHHNVPVVPVHVNENKDNDNEKSLSEKEELNIYPQADNRINTRNIGGKINKSSEPEQFTKAAAAPRELSKYQKLSKTLKNNVLHFVILAKMLFEKKFNDYTPIDNRKLKLEVLYGSLTREEFRELLLVEMIKTAAKLWKNWKYGDVYMGEWIKTIKLLQRHYFLNSNGTVPSKETLYQLLLQYKLRLKFANSYQNLNPEWNLPAPSNYFNPYLKTTGFSRTKIFLKKHLERKKTEENNAKKRKQSAYEIERKKALWRKIEYRINRLEKGKMTPVQFMNWIDSNTSGISREEIQKYINNRKQSLMGFNELNLN